MNVYEMEGFLRGKCLPGDIKINESNAEYLVRKLNAASELEGEVTALVATLEKCKEMTYCPSAIDLQDHLKQLMAVDSVQPVPLVPNIKKLALELVDNLVDCGGLDEGVKERYLKWAEKTCRAAMLSGKAKPLSDGFPSDEIECDICGHVSTDPEGRHHCCEDNSND